MYIEAKHYCDKMYNILHLILPEFFLSSVLLHFLLFPTLQPLFYVIYPCASILYSISNSYSDLYCDENFFEIFCVSVQLYHTQPCIVSCECQRGICWRRTASRQRDVQALPVNQNIQDRAGAPMRRRADAPRIITRDRRSRGAVSRAAGDQKLRGYKNTVYAIHAYTN